MDAAAAACERSCNGGAAVVDTAGLKTPSLTYHFCLRILESTFAYSPWHSDPEMPAGNKILSFRAGKMNMSGTTVVADPTKGLIELHKENIEGGSVSVLCFAPKPIPRCSCPSVQMLYFVWRNRTTNSVSPSDELTIVGAGDYTWKRVHQCKLVSRFRALLFFPGLPCSRVWLSTGRVFLLSFYGEKRFFWMQEPDATKDAEYACNYCACRHVMFLNLPEWKKSLMLQILRHFEARDGGFHC